jgi:hypothetical protein
MAACTSVNNDSLTGKTAELTLVNRRSTTMELWLEPWGDVLQIQPESAVRLEFVDMTNVAGSVFMVECLKDGLRIWLERPGTGSLSVFEDGVLAWKNGIRRR